MVIKEEIKYQWISLPQWQRIVILVIFVAIILYVMFFFLISPKKDEIQRLEKEVKDLQQKVEILRKTAKPEELRKLNEKILAEKKEIQQIKQSIKEMEAKIPPDPHLEDLVLTVSSAISLSKMEIKNLNIKKEKLLYVYKEGDKLVFREKPKQENRKRPRNKRVEKKSPELKISEIPVIVEVVGSIKNLKHSLDLLSNSKRFISVEKLSLYKDKNGLLNSKIFLKTYYLPEKKK